VAGTLSVTSVATMRGAACAPAPPSNVSATTRWVVGSLPTTLPASHGGNAVGGLGGEELGLMSEGETDGVADGAVVGRTEGEIDGDVGAGEADSSLEPAHAGAATRAIAAAAASVLMAPPFRLDTAIVDRTPVAGQSRRSLTHHVTFGPGSDGRCIPG